MPKVVRREEGVAVLEPRRSLRSPGDYQFDDEASLDRAMKGDDLKRLVADFNRDWPDVTRTRETFVLAEEFAA